MAHMPVKKRPSNKDLVTINIPTDYSADPDGREKIVAFQGVCKHPPARIFVESYGGHTDWLRDVCGVCQKILGTHSDKPESPITDGGG
jgi:hypothetical protein